LLGNLSLVLGVIRKSSPLLVSPATIIGLTVVIAIILLASNFTIINAQQQQQQEFTSQPGEVENRRAAAGTATTAAGRTFQSTNDSFSVQVPDGWIIHDVDSAGFTSLEESRQGYVMLAQLCPEEEQQRILSNADSSTNSSSTSTSNGCQGAQEVIHIIRYPDLRTRLSTNNVTTTNNNMTTTTDNILSYHLQKLQEVGYRDIEIVNSIERTVNLTNAQTNQTIQTVPAKFVEMTYATVSAPNETREGYFILTATNATAPNPGMTKGYSVFYEGGSSVAATAKNTAEITTASGSLIPSLSPPVGQVLDSFELIAAPEATQAVVQTGQGGGVGQAVQSECDASYPDVCIPSPPPELNCDDVDFRNFRVLSPDPHGFDGDNDGIGCDLAGDSGGDDVGDGDEDDEEDDGGDNSCDPSYPDVCIPSPPPELNCDDEGVPENFEVSGSDPHGFDGDNDGIGCESGNDAPDDDSDDVEDDDDNGADDDDNPEDGSEEGQPLGGVLPRTPPTPEGGVLAPPETGEEGQPLGGLPPAPPSNDNGEGVSPTPEEEEGGESPPETGEEGGQGSEEGLPPAPPSNDNGEGVSPTPEGGQGSENEFEDCVVPPGMDPGDVGC
jgi:hypothetical protein